MRLVLSLLLFGGLACTSDSRPFCGDGVCGGSGESCAVCSIDCGSCGGLCGNGVCNPGETCASCVGDCGACPSGSCTDSCTGCCDGDSCLSGTSASACNTNGNGCVDCGPDGACVAGVCMFDPASRWNIVLETVSVSTTNTLGEAWDAFGGAPDPFVEVRVGAGETLVGTSGAGSDVFAVSFTGGATATDQRADALGQGLRFDVHDLDTTVHDFVGACVRTGIGRTDLLGGTQTMDCPRAVSSGNAGFTLTWHFERF